MRRFRCPAPIPSGRTCWSQPGARRDCLHGRAFRVHGGGLNLRARGHGAEGVGLYRSEFAFLLRQEAPDEETQYGIYRELLKAFSPQSVTVRTLDAGSDKPLPYLQATVENPALGQRGMRLSLAHPELFLTQLRALLSANAGIGNLRLLLPMVTGVMEVRQARTLIEQAHREVEARVGRCPLPSLGIMVEVPATMLRISDFAPLVDRALSDSATRFPIR
jgi:phosphotransferase system enzyme I (PtsP)